MRAKPPPPGFTLIELLVVLAIVALLASLVVSGAAKGIQSGQRTRCLSNLRQIGLAVLTHATEHQGRLPPTRHSAAADEAWVTVLRPYLGNVDEIRISPADPNGAERLRRGGTSYLANDLIFDPRTDAFGNVLPDSIRGLFDLQAPSQTLLAVIASDNRGLGATNDHTHTATWTTWTRFLADVEADRFRSGARSSNRLAGDSNYLYADGGVRNLKAHLLKDWIDSGRNPGRPENAPR